MDAFGAALITGLIVYIIVLTLQPVRDYFDSDRKPDEKITYSNVIKTMKTVISTPLLRDLAFGSFSFGELQSIFAGFLFYFQLTA